MRRAALKKSTPVGELTLDELRGLMIRRIMNIKDMDPEVQVNAFTVLCHLRAVLDGNIDTFDGEGFGDHSSMYIKGMSEFDPRYVKGDGSYKKLST